MSKQKVSIVIPCRNEAKYIQKNIESILAQDYEGEITALICDGESDDGTVEIVQKLANDNPGKVRLINNPDRFTPQALNLGIRAQDFDVFIILGGHAYLKEDFVRRNIEELEKDNAVGCAGGVINNIYENKDGEIISRAMSSKFAVGNATFRTGGKKGYVDTVAFGAYRKEVYEKIGGFDEVLVRNQDDEYNYRVTSEGFKILFDPSIESFYYVRGNIQKLWNQYFQYGYWKVFIGKKHKAVTTLRQLVPLIFVLGLIVGGVLSLIIPNFYLLYSAGVLSYVFLAILFGAKSAKPGSPEGLKIALIFAILHLSYGFGYLKGIIHFIFMGKNPSEKSKALTR